MKNITNFGSYLFACVFGFSIVAITHMGVTHWQYWAIFVPGALWHISGAVREIYREKSHD